MGVGIVALRAVAAQKLFDGLRRRLGGLHGGDRKDCGDDQQVSECRHRRHDRGPVSGSGEPSRAATEGVRLDAHLLGDVDEEVAERYLVLHLACDFAEAAMLVAAASEEDW